MKLPEIGYDVGKARSEIVAMGGINYSDRFKDGDMRHSVNLSARRWPYITTRRAREQQSGYSGVTALTAWGKLVAVRGTDLLYDGNVVGQVTPGEKQFAVVNTKLVIWPDKVYLDLESKTVKPLGASLTFSPRSVAFTENTIQTNIRPVMVKGKEYTDSEGTQETGPGFEHFMGMNFSLSSENFYFRRCTAIDRNPAGWDLTGETTVGINELRLGDLVRLRSWSEDDTELACLFGNDGNWSFDATAYAVITGIDMTVSLYSDCWLTYDVVYCPLKNSGSAMESFKAGDALTISGAGENSKESAIVQEVTDSEITFSGNSFVPMKWIDAEVTLTRKVPDLDFICESENRLWGCSSQEQTIYASSLGDPANFFVFKGLATDSYAVAVGTDGDFTGCCKLGSSVLFWKETKLHKVLGSYPAEYSVYTYETEGLKAGCHKSLQVINDVLFYMGIHGVYIYTGGTPSLVSDCFGELELTDAVAGTDGDSYYLSAKEEKGTGRHFFLYEPKFSIWVREDDTQAVDFARIGRKLYFSDGAGRVWLADSGKDDANMEWLCQFTPFYETLTGRKRYSKILIRLELPKGSWVIADVRYNGGSWRECGKIIGRKSDVIPMRLALNRCDKFEIRLRGKGNCTILSMMREYSIGSDV